VTFKRVQYLPFSFQPNSIVGKPAIYAALQDRLRTRPTQSSQTKHNMTVGVDPEYKEKCFISTNPNSVIAWEPTQSFQMDFGIPSLFITCIVELEGHSAKISISWLQ
jgi:hypothetical protein